MKYIEMKAAIVAAEKAHRLDVLDHLSRDLLHEIATANLKSARITITDLISQHPDFTAPTIFARLKKLVDGGWVAKIDDTVDKRSFLLEITPQARTAFKKMSKALEGH